MRQNKTRRLLRRCLPAAIEEIYKDKSKLTFQCRGGRAELVILIFFAFPQCHGAFPASPYGKMLFKL